ncbi:MAG: RAMP superfamily CRISPR-associated protein [Candidatus Paceibacterota bacterium]
MPHNEKFWNPYRWVEVGDQPIQHETPHYHHRLEGLSGLIECTLEALTPLIIGDGKGDFVRHKHNHRPYIPATSLKGSIRSLVELVGNAAVPFPNVTIDSAHELSQARVESEGQVKFDVAARTFGYLNAGHVFAGLVQFGDGELVGDATVAQWPTYSVAVGQPKPSHQPFYPGSNRRKSYHHQPSAERLTGPHAGITQTSTVRPAPPGTTFRFSVDFRNLRDGELNLLLYCLALEDEVSVTLSPAALGPDAREQKILCGPMRHKLGGCKPHGGGSADIRITRMTIRTNPADRYRGADSAQTFADTALSLELQRRTAPFAQRSDPTMQQLRAMMIYSSDDPRGPVNYPEYQWFQEDKQLPPADKRRLKPTM